ncbi:Protein bric-a-brac 2 [Papilio machaon]|uniref:Protein bric-a-brac 2 n=1 Tax=Papilio machaon TaxID=76193 RepID=A0A194QZ67_PAPMA|nr:Protein bric-a-brac 2 [Papilio machaon]
MFIQGAYKIYKSGPSADQVQTLRLLWAGGKQSIAHEVRGDVRARCGRAGWVRAAGAAGRRAAGVARRRLEAPFAATSAPPSRRVPHRRRLPPLSASRVAARVARKAPFYIKRVRCRCEHAAVKTMPAEEEPAPMDARDAADGSPQQFCLRWNNYQSNLANCFDQLLQTESFVDVTLACEGRSLKAHKVVLSACSPYFQTLFMDNPCRHPIIIMRDIKYCDLKAVVDFMYRGEINVSQDQISALLKVAETLKVRGLTDVSGEPAVLRAGGAGSAGTSAAAEARGTKRAGSHEPESPGQARRRVADPGPLGAHGSPDHLLPPDVPAPPPLHADDVDIRPGIAEMIREEERVSTYTPAPTVAPAPHPRRGLDRAERQAADRTALQTFPAVAARALRPPCPSPGGAPRSFHSLAKLSTSYRVP